MIVHVTSGATLVPMPLAIARVVSKQVAEPVWLARSLDGVLCQRPDGRELPCIGISIFLSVSLEARRQVEL